MDFHCEVWHGIGRQWLGARCKRDTRSPGTAMCGADSGVTTRGDATLPSAETERKPLRMSEKVTLEIFTDYV